MRALRASLPVFVAASLACGPSTPPDDGGNRPGENLAPSIASVEIDPATPRKNEPLTCRWTGFSDPEGAADQSYASWTIDGEFAGEGPTLASGAAPGVVVRCTVVPFDGEVEGDPVFAEVTVANGAPTLSEVTISPADPKANDTLTCSAKASDPDGDDTTALYTWRLDGEVIGTGAQLTGGFGKGDVVVCEAMASDGVAESAPATASVTIANSAPVITQLTITPVPLLTASAPVTCVATTEDADGEEATVAFAWWRNGTPAGTGAVFQGGLARGDVLACEAIPSDAEETGEAVRAEATVVNAKPVIADVTLTPANPVATDTITCSATAADEDGDAVSLAYAWRRNGAVVVGMGPVLTGGFVGGDVITCTVTPHDGVDAGAAHSASVTIANSVPVISAVQIAPSPALSSDTLTCSATATDADGDAVSLSYAWKKNGTAIGTGATLVGVFRHRDEITCEVTPHDGHTEGAIASAELTISNSPPSFTGANISPATPYNDSPLTCAGEGASDPDGETVEVKLSWTINGAPAGNGASPTGALKPGDVVECTATPNDGTSDGPPHTATVTIANRAPTLTGATLAPSGPQSASVFTCAPVGLADPDGDVVSAQFAWRVNGSTLTTETGSTLSGQFDRGDQITCTITPHDGAVAGASQVATFQVNSSAPQFAGPPVLTPEPPRTASTLTASVTATDPDGDPVRLIWRWLRDGAPVGSNASTLSGVHFARGHQVQVEVTATDGKGASATVTSDVVTVVNTPPTAPLVDATPHLWAADDEPLTCTARGSNDDDGDTPVYRFTWLLDDVPSGITSATVPAASTRVGQKWQCQVRAFDGFEESPAMLAPEIRVVNDLRRIVLSSDTTWTAADGPYRLQDSIFIPENVTLTLEPGVIVVGQGRGITVKGVLEAVGTATERIVLHDVTIRPNGTEQSPGFIDIEFAHIIGGGVYESPVDYGYLTLRDSVLEGTSHLYLWYPSADSFIERNIFTSAGGISVGTDHDVKVYVRNNVFYDQTTPYAVQVWATYETSATVVKHNSFLSTDRIALRLYDDGLLDGTENYWGGATDAQVPTLIFDRSDDRTLLDTIPHHPTLPEPHPATPSTAGWIP